MDIGLKPIQQKDKKQEKMVPIPIKKTSPDLDVSTQKFNPGTPPINSFMTRLTTRHITY